MVVERRNVLVLICFLDKILEEDLNIMCSLDLIQNGGELPTESLFLYISLLENIIFLEEPE